jgi:hypothetical protein
MSGSNLWGNLKESQDSDKTIRQAIDDMIADHDNNSASHLGPTGSLNSHAASAIIDHLAQSILNDKLEPASRANIAIVANDGSGDYTDIAQAVAFANQKGGGRIFIKRGYYYPSDDIELGLAVDLQGDSLGDTFIDFGNANKGIKGYKGLSLNGESYEPATFTNGSKIVTFPAGTKLLTGRFPVWPGMLIHDWYAGDDYFVDTVDSETQLHITLNYASPTNSDGADINLYGLATNGSKIVTFPTGTKLITFGIVPNYIFDNAYSSSFSSIIQSVDSETQITLKDNFTYPTGSDIFDIMQPLPSINEISDLCVQNSQATYAIDCSGVTPANVNRCNFINCKGILYSTVSNGRVGRCCDNDFSLCTGPTLFHLYRFIFSGNYGTISSNGVSCISLNNMISIHDNFITGHGDANSYFMLVGNGNFPMYGNFIANFAHFDDAYLRSGGYSMGLRCFGNQITMPTNYDFDLYYHYASFVGNYIYTAGSGKPHLNTACQNVVCVGNRVFAAVVDNGTSDVVANNG